MVTGAKIIPIAPNIDGIEILHRNGDVMYYENQSRDAQYEVRFMVDTSEESSVVITDPAYFSSDTVWSPGDRVIIFRKVDGYYLANDSALISGAISFPPGSVGVRIIDNTHSQLIAYEGAGTIGGPTITPTPEPTTIPPTPTPTPVQNCLNCGLGEGFPSHLPHKSGERSPSGSRMIHHRSPIPVHGHSETADRHKENLSSTPFQQAEHTRFP